MPVNKIWGIGVQLMDIGKPEYCTELSVIEIQTDCLIDKRFAGTFNGVVGQIQKGDNRLEPVFEQFSFNDLENTIFESKDEANAALQKMPKAGDAVYIRDNDKLLKETVRGFRYFRNSNGMMQISIQFANFNHLDMPLRQWGKTIFSAKATA